MTARRTPPPQKVSFSPAGESATYKDLLFFEERLKANAANLRRRKSRYQRESHSNLLNLQKETELNYSHSCAAGRLYTVPYV